jgi:transcriptional regulator with XRE-family HTH domain
MLDLSRLGQNIRYLRHGRNWSLADLEEHSKVPKAYLSDLENNKGGKPNIQYLFQIATALGTTVDGLIHGASEEAASDGAPVHLPPGLREFADEEGLSSNEVTMLAGLNFRGNRPKDKTSWRTIFEVIKLASK